MQNWIVPVTLSGNWVRLEPMQQDHFAAVYQTITPGLLRYFALPGLNAQAELSFEDFSRGLQAAMQERVVFATVRQDTGEVVGTTSYLTIEPANRGVEIGSTWIRKEEQGSKINPEAKYLMLRHAFETLEAIRVSLKTHHLNLQSQRAIEKLGAVKEGVLRNHMVMPDGSRRHSVMYSILDTEWPEVKAGLEGRLGLAQTDQALS